MSHLPIFIISDNFEGEKCCSYPELRDEKTRRLEFNSSSLLILNSLEQLGYKVVTSGSFVASQVGEEMKCCLKKICCTSGHLDMVTVLVSFHTIMEGWWLKIN